METFVAHVSDSSLAGPVEPSTCNNCAESGNEAGDRWTAATAGTFGEAFTSTCGTTPDVKLPPCSKFYFTGQKRARNCGGTLRCYAEAQLTPGGPKYWMFRCGVGLAVCSLVVQGPTEISVAALLQPDNLCLVLAMCAATIAARTR